MLLFQNRIISIYKRKTSMCLTDIEWKAVDELCKHEHISNKQLFELITENKDNKLNLTSSVRLFSIIYYKSLYLYKKYPDKKLLPPLYQAIKAII